MVANAQSWSLSYHNKDPDAPVQVQIGHLDNSDGSGRRVIDTSVFFVHYQYIEMERLVTVSFDGYREYCREECTAD